MLTIGLLFISLAAGGLTPAFQMGRVNKEIVSTLKEAWRLAGSGRSSREAGVLLLQNDDGSYNAKLVFDPDAYRQVRFEVTEDVVAMLHTHPNDGNSEPSPQDKRNADFLQIPTFTISATGLWVYNPRTRQTRIVMLDETWMDPANWTEKVAAQAGL